MNYEEYWFDLCQAIENNDQAQIDMHMEEYRGQED
jgi:hypothetical protein